MLPEMLGELLDSLGAMDLYVLEGNSAHALIEAREKSVGRWFETRPSHFRGGR
jgi:hypothetical protein